MPGLGQLQGFPVALPSAGDRDLTLRIISPARVPIMDAGEILQSALRVLPGPVVAVFDRYARKLYVTTDTAKQVALMTAVDLGQPTSNLTLAPDAGQTGQALQWSAVGEWQWGYPAVRDRVLVAVKPRMSVYAVLNWIASQSAAQFVLINQAQAQIAFSEHADMDTVRAAVEAAGAEVAIAIEPPTNSDWP